MSKPTDKYIEFTEITVKGADKMIEAYTNIVNEALNSDKQGFSAIYGEMLPWNVTDFWIEHIEDKYYIGIEWGLVRFLTKEEFMGAALDEDSKDMS